MYAKEVGKAQRAINNKALNCMVPGCRRNEIKSHSQKKKRQLSAISANSKVYALHKNYYQSIKKSVSSSSVLDFNLTGFS